MGYDLNSSAESKDTPTEYAKLIKLGMMNPYSTPEVSVPGGNQHLVCGY